MTKQVWELGAGDLFIWDAWPDYLHQATDERDESSSPVANHIATKGEDGKWRFHDLRPNSWNPYCPVQVIEFGSR
jgi:hypothetical protein